MSLARKLRSGLTYANVMSSIAVFVALGGGAYALSVPKNSVGARQLKRSAVTSAKIRRNAVSSAKIQRGAVTSAQIRDRSLQASDLAPGVIPAPTPAAAAPAPLVLGGTHAADADPPASPGSQLETATLSLGAAGKAFVLGTLNGPFLTCAVGNPCNADWGVYVDGQPVPASGLHLQAAANSGDGFDFYTLFGVTPTLQPGSHTVTLNTTSAGSPASVGQLGSQLGAIAVGA